MKKEFVLKFVIFILLVAFSSQVFLVVSAQEGSDANLDTLNDQIDQKRASMDQLNRQIDSYKENIERLQAQEASLFGEIDLLENRIAKTQLDIEATKISIDVVNTQLRSLEQETQAIEQKLDRDREFIAEILRQIQVEDTAIPLQLMFGTESFSELFDSLERLENVSEDLKKTVDQARETKLILEEKLVHEQEKKDQLLELEQSLSRELDQFADETKAKETLIIETQQSEAEFAQLLQQVKQEQAFIHQQVTALQQEIEGRLSKDGVTQDSSVLSWPVNPAARGISAYFHDPTYPFRHLFEHSGLDLPAAQGTPVVSAATGYVAWTKTGRLYGNYVMIIHTNGLSTLYAHLSSINVVPDQFVNRGDVIGAVGSTGFSTGPHVHFEVRKDGIPTNPLDYLTKY